ncbi:transposase [Salinibacter ruber]|jgi:transposase|uniref:Transposase n=1 Tax=Salinibacter ruber TaxID=146919 RepID=A0A9X2QF45_9BACT|nr:transposase [Salinibacter ruber]MCS3658355.1 transposase [Salinibacter ruber]MCS3661437.1 transposase [Salinibacter ruber]MCS3711333.1 transposase [Salinibacter ruber]
MPRKTYTTDLTDAEWELIEPLPPPKPIAALRGRPPQSRERDFLHYKNGCTWRDLPGGLS